MPSSTRATTRLASRSPPDAAPVSALPAPAPPSASTTATAAHPLSAAVSYTTNSSSAPITSCTRLPPRHSHSHSHVHADTHAALDRSASPFPSLLRAPASASAPAAPTSVPLPVLLRRYWKRLNEDDVSGRRSRVSQAVAAFKMGLYFKALITLILFLRFASHASQRAYPAAAIDVDAHFRAIVSAPSSPTLRIIVVTDNGYSAQLRPLLQSLADADYDRDTADVDVWMFATSLCNYMPLPLYPLAMAVFGPPRFDHSTATVFSSLHWPHGTKSLVALREEADWSRVWESNRGTTNETLLFVDATLADSLSPAYYIWLKRARVAVQRGMIANAAVVSLDAVSVPDEVPPTDRAVLLEQFFPATAAYSPSQDVWITFLKWYALRRSWFARPRLPRDLSVGGFPFLHSMRVQPVRAWFAQFLATYGERVVHPVLPDGQVLVVRARGSASPSRAGVGVAGRPPALSRNAERDESRFNSSSDGLTMPERPLIVKSNGSVTTADAPFGLTIGKKAGRTRRVVIGDLVDANAAATYAAVVRQIGEFARSRGSESISFTMVTAAFVDTAMSWLCNVVSLDIVPPALVIVASDRDVAKALSDFMATSPRLGQGSLVVPIDGVLTTTDDEHKDAHFGTSQYWLLMLQRTLLLRDLLTRGLSILQLETDQIWFSDPLPYIKHELRTWRGTDGGWDDVRVPDMVVTTNTLREVAGNFFYLRPTVSSRQLLCAVVDKFYTSYQASLRLSAARSNKFHYIQNDQSLLTRLLTGKDWAFARKFPGVKTSTLNRELFVDGTWFTDFEDEHGQRVKRRSHYTSDSSLYPVVLNNNFVIGVDERTRRAKRFGMWFLKTGAGGGGGGDGGRQECDEAAVRQAVHSGYADVDGVARVGRGATRREGTAAIADGTRIRAL